MYIYILHAAAAHDPAHGREPCILGHPCLCTYVWKCMCVCVYIFIYI